MLDLTVLNPEQKDAVISTTGSLLVLAGAGTGKTRVLTYRIAYLIMQNIAQPDQILAVTFTNKAAKEMSERVTELLMDAHALGSAVNLGTFHALAARILRRHAELFNLTPYFTIINADDQLKLIKTLIKEAGVDHKEHPPKIIAGIISRWKDLNLRSNEVSNSDILTSNHKIAREIYPKYQEQLVRSNAVDFGDLLLYNNHLFMAYPDILSAYQERFKYILIDEYQDTNTAQYLWARMLASKHKNLCCVGDDDQSIYSWRGAEVGNILKFNKDFPSAKIVKLEQNYRSSSVILQAASTIIRHNATRHKKTLWTEANQGSLIQIMSCWNDKEEARLICSEMQRLKRNHNKNYNDIAVLVRAGFQTRAFEEVFVANAMPYRIIGGLKFYERMEIRDVLAYIRIVRNHDDNLAFERIINVPKRGIGSVTLQKIRQHGIERDISALKAAQEMIEAKSISGKSSSALKQLIDGIKRWAGLFQSAKPDEVVKTILEESGYLPLLKAEKTDESRSRIENINEMLSAIEEYSDIQDFIEHTSLVMDNDSNADMTGAISVMTLHAAKGLEFDTVFLPGWEEGLFPHQKSLSEEGLKGIEEERRIAYVGITRAKANLYISYAESRRTFGEFVTSIPSRFIAELPKEICHFISANKNINYLGARHNVTFEQKTKSIKASSMREDNTKFESDSMRPGGKVQHKIFGKGIIIKRREDNLEIVFEKNGLKTVKESFVTAVN